MTYQTNPDDIEILERLRTLESQVQFCVDYMDSYGLLGDRCFTFPDGETIHATRATDDPYRATISSKEAGVRITVSVEYPGLPGMTTDEVKKECDRRARTVVQHFKQIIPRV